eukprot:3684-Heterococcus_DN1.PRE.2
MYDSSTTKLPMMYSSMEMHSAYLRSKHTRAGITWMQSADIQCAVFSHCASCAEQMEEPACNAL